ncbi:MAG: SulP family inorganic anion transporter [Magnetococcales bacterium]|nr:SulP family inorganic anion transporter [Magnetococcales bacterium]
MNGLTRFPMERVFPFLRWRSRISGRTVRQDVTAGLTGAIIAAPQGVAFAAIAGMPPEYGLYSGMVPAILAALFGSSWHLVSGPTTAASIVLFSILSQHAEPGSAAYVQLALTLTFVVGLMELLMGVFRLGVVLQFVSHSVVTGFTAGAALLIATQQLKHFFGLPIPQGSSFFHAWGYWVEHLSQINPLIPAVGTATLLVGMLFRRFVPRIPYMLAALLGGILFALLWKKLDPQAAAAIVTVGAIPASLPPLSSPEWSLEGMRGMLAPALAVTLLALTEAGSIARAMASRTGQRIDGDQEFIGQGLSNLVGSFFSSYVATGSFNRSSVNLASGARTPLAAIFGGLFLALLTPLAAPALAYLPNAAMAGVLFIVSYTLIDFAHLRHAFHTSLSETAVLVLTFAATVLVGLEEAILLGAMLSLGLYLRRTSRPRIVARVPDPRDPRRGFTSDAALPECPQLRLARIDGSLFYGAIHHVHRTLDRMDEKNGFHPHLAVVASGVNFVDMAGAEWLAEEAERRRAAGGGLYLIRVKQPVRQTLEKSGALAVIGSDHLFSSKREAIGGIFSRLDPEVCRRCDKRIFLECARPEEKAMRLTTEERGRGPVSLEPMTAPMGAFFNAAGPV